MATTTRPNFDATIARQMTKQSASASADRKNSAARVPCGLHGEAEDFLEIGEAVVAAEAHVVPEEGEEQREGHRLGDDREIDAGDARAEGEPAEDEGEKARRQHDHQKREGEMTRSPTNTRGVRSS